MAIILRPFTPEDVPVAGRILHQAFTAIAAQHNFPSDFPDPDFATSRMSRLCTAAASYGVAAELDGVLAGSNFVHEQSPIVGIGPISVDPAVQNRGVGAALMQNLIDRSLARSVAGIRLLQAGYHTRSLCLYSKLGFVVREPIANMQGPPLRREIAGYPIRAATSGDFDACNRLCRDVHGHDRAGELRDAIAAGTAQVVERGGAITAYTTQIAFYAHAVARSNDDLKALIAAAPVFAGPGFMLPSRNTELFQWCLAQGLRMVQPMTLMTIGLYNEPQGAYLPSILF